MDQHQPYLRRALDVARRSKKKGNLPYGCLFKEEALHVHQD